MNNDVCYVYHFATKPMVFFSNSSVKIGKSILLDFIILWIEYILSFFKIEKWIKDVWPQNEYIFYCVDLLLLINIQHILYLEILK